MFTDHDRFVIEKRIYRRPWLRIFYCFIRNKYVKSTYKQVVKAIRKEGYKYKDIINQLRVEERMKRRSKHER